MACFGTPFFGSKGSVFARRSAPLQHVFYELVARNLPYQANKTCRLTPRNGPLSWLLPGSNFHMFASGLVFEIQPLAVAAFWFSIFGSPSNVNIDFGAVSGTRLFRACAPAPRRRARRWRRAVRRWPGRCPPSSPWRASRSFLGKKDSHVRLGIWIAQTIALVLGIFMDFFFGEGGFSQLEIPLPCLYFNRGGYHPESLNIFSGWFSAE